MGWLGNSKNSAEPLQISPSNGEDPTDRASARQAPNADGLSASSHDGGADAEIHALLACLENPVEADKLSSAQFTTTPLSASASASAKTITPSTLYPTEISCRAAFDSAFYCQSLGGQFINIYRYGTFRDCRQQWKDFWYCMRTNRGFLGDKERESR
ncbi:MAG: hypothetical protein Q9218_004118, partial [Villophora microphyllina]